MTTNDKHADYDLVDRYLQGDEEAGSELYAGVYAKLKWYIRKKTGDMALTETDREEILSDTLDTSIRKLETYAGQSSFCTFICGIGNIKILEWIRAKRKENHPPVIRDDSDDRICLWDDPLHILIKKEQYETLERAINMLMLPQQDVIRLRSNDMTVREIAAMCPGMSEDAVRSQYYRALKDLKKNFEKIYNNRDGFC